MTLSNLVLVTRQEAEAAEITVLSGSTGKPVVGAEVLLYRYDWNKKHQRIATNLSDDRGIVRFQPSRTNAQYFLVAKKGSQIAFDAQHIYFHQRYDPSHVSSALIFTDRSIYRPMQKLFWKAVAYSGRPREARFETARHHLRRLAYDFQWRGCGIKNVIQ
jgi:uncharacterized protein YfaS (alpha-2-macroglobulin family)